MWEEFSAAEGDIVYFDSVVGVRHHVDERVPALALEAAREGEDSQGLDYRYMEPITAMQDDDVEFPDHVEYAYYAIYNLFRKYALGADVDGWLIVNQSLSALPEQEWERALEEAVVSSQ